MRRLAALIKTDYPSPQAAANAAERRVCVPVGGVGEGRLLAEPRARAKELTGASQADIIGTRNESTKLD